MDNKCDFCKCLDSSILKEHLISYDAVKFDVLLRNTYIKNGIDAWYDSFLKFDLNFCPVCGRKIEEVEKITYGQKYIHRS